MNRPAAHGMDLVLKRHRIIRVAQKIKMKAAQVDPAVIVHEKAFYSPGIFRHTENQYIIHKLSSAIAGISSFPVTCPAAFFRLFLQSYSNIPYSNIPYSNIPYSDLPSRRAFWIALAV
jgi:hypothetical protein